VPCEESGPRAELRGISGQRPEATLVVTFTDKEENASRRFTRHQIHSLVSARQEQGWSFVFPAPGSTPTPNPVYRLRGRFCAVLGARRAGRLRGLRQPVPLHRRLPPPFALGHGCCQRRLTSSTRRPRPIGSARRRGNVAANPTGPRARMIGSGGRRGRRMTDHG